MWRLKRFWSRIVLRASYATKPFNWNAHIYLYNRAAGIYDDTLVPESEERDRRALRESTSND